MSNHFKITLYLDFVPFEVDISIWLNIFNLVLKGLFDILMELRGLPIFIGWEISIKQIFIWKYSCWSAKIANVLRYMWDHFVP